MANGDMPYERKIGHQQVCIYEEGWDLHFK